MIFVGTGALLKRAVELAVAGGFRVDLVVTRGTELTGLCRRNAIPLEAMCVNRQWKRIAERSSDGLLFSINNDQVFREPALSDPAMRLFNVHNGLIPAYRGRPEVCLVYALLNGEPEYGVTLHEIDDGIDTGPTLDTLRFAIEPSDDFETTMLRAVDACDEIFRRNLERVAAGRLEPRARPALPSRLYRLRDLELLWKYQSSPHLRRATQFGVFQPWFPDSWRLVRDQLRQLEAISAPLTARTDHPSRSRERRDT